MKKIILFGVLGVFTLLLVLLATLLVLAPRIINRPAVKNRIEAAASRAVGGQVVYERAALSLLPHPHVSILAPRLSIPGTLSGTLKSIDVYAELRPLFSGQLRITAARFDHPDITVILSEQGGKSEDSPGSSVTAVLEAVALNMPNMAITIQKGRLAVTERTQRLIELREIDAQMALPLTTGEPGGAPPGESFQIVGDVRGVMTDDQVLPGPVTVTVKRFEARPRTFSFTDATARMLDASFTVSGRIDDYLTTRHAADLTLDGTIGPDSMRVIKTLFSLPPELSIHVPVTLSTTRLRLDHDGSLQLEGTATVQKSMTVSFDVVRTPELINVKTLRIQDAESQATLGFTLAHHRLDLAFSGNLTRASLNNLFEHQLVRFGWVRGELATHIVLDRPFESTANGTIEGEQLVLPVALERPVVINRVVLTAAGRTITFKPLVITLDKKVHTLTGDITPSAKEWRLNLQSDGVEWESLQPFFAPQTAHTRPVTPDRQQTPVKATIRLSTAYFSIGGWTAAPARADIKLGADGARIAIHEAVVCGVNLPGTVMVAPDKFSIDLQPAASHQDLNASVACLSGEKNRITGTFDLSGHVNATGIDRPLLNTLQGNINVTAKDGRLFQKSLVVQLLTYLSVTELLRGSYPDPGKDGVPYTSLTLKGTMRTGILTIDEAALISPAVDLAGGGSITLPDRTMDVTVLAAPFTTVETVVKQIPLLRDILGNSVVTIPIRISGPIDDPKFKSIPPSAVADQLVGIMNRTLGLPFKMMEPLMPGKNTR